MERFTSARVRLAKPLPSRRDAQRMPGSAQLGRTGLGRLCEADGILAEVVDSVPLAEEAAGLQRTVSARSIYHMP